MSGDQSDERALIKSANTEAEAASKMATAADKRSAVVASNIQQAAPVWRQTVTITYYGLLALNLAPKLAPFDIPSAKKGDRIQIFEDAEPSISGIALAGGFDHADHATVHADGKVNIRYVLPAIGVGQSLSMPLLLVAYRDV